MVVRDLDVMGVAPDPAEADAPLIIDPDAVLTGTVASQLFETVSGRRPEILKPHRRVELAQLSQGHPLNVGPKLPDRLALEEPLGVLVTEAPNHTAMITRRVMTRKGVVGGGVCLTDRK